MSRAPDGLIGIGEFSRRSGLSIKTLRHYHRLGLLVPMVVQPGSGYRYYGVDQIGEVEDCRALTLVGVPLRRIRDLVCGGMRARDLRATLLEARARSGERIRAEAARLSWLESSIAAVTRTLGPPGDSGEDSIRVDFVPVEPRPIVSLREPLAEVGAGDGLRDELARRWGPGEEVRRELGAVTIWHDCGRSTGRVDCEAAIAAEATGAGRVARLRGLRPGMLEAAIVARVRPAPGAPVSEAYRAGWRRLASLDLSLVGPVREWVRYARGRALVTEIHFPVAPL
jgi:DNA-binding transcriptional MerR regulator